MAGEEFFTDANSLAMVKRVRGVHAAFAAKPLEDRQIANPIGGNYFPITSAMYLRDSATGRQLSLVTDRGQGAALADWQLISSVHLCRSAQFHMRMVSQASWGMLHTQARRFLTPSAASVGA